jgi:hypothetical protein
MADETGGEVIEVKRPLSITAALENAITNLQMQYALGFNPSDRGLLRLSEEAENATFEVK